MNDTKVGAGIRMVPKLKYEHISLTSYEHISLTSFSKMHVDLATQVSYLLHGIGSYNYSVM